MIFNGFHTHAIAIETHGIQENTVIAISWVTRDIVHPMKVTMLSAN